MLVYNVKRGFIVNFDGKGESFTVGEKEGKIIRRIREGQYIEAEELSKEIYEESDKRRLNKLSRMIHDINQKSEKKIGRKIINNRNAIGYTLEEELWIY